MYLQTSRLQYNLQGVSVFQKAHSDKNIQAEACRYIIPQNCEYFNTDVRVHIMRLKKDKIYGIINAESLAIASLWAAPFAHTCACVIDGFAKMPLQASIFASW